MKEEPIMTALLKKDLYLVGKQSWILLGVALLFSFMPQFESFGSAYLMVLAITLPLTTLAYDERCHWDTYLSMTPCRPERVVCSKYVFTALLAVAALAVTLLAGLLKSAFVHGEYDLIGNMVQRVSLLVVILTVNAVTLPTIFRFGVEKGRLTMMALMFGIFGIIVGGAKLIGEERMFGWLDQVSLAGLGIAAAAVTIALNAASFFLSVRFYRKRQAGAYD